MRILLVEDEAQTAALLAKGLRENAYAVDVGATGAGEAEVETGKAEVELSAASPK